MSALSLTPALRQEYSALFMECVIRADRFLAVDAFTHRMLVGCTRYSDLIETKGWTMPWWFLGVIHGLEGSFGWGTHLHNGDSLRAKTVHDPKGRPMGTPPFTWEESAVDSMEFEGLTGWNDWSLPGALYRLERYNGFGYRQYHKEVLSPYLWSASNHYTCGKYASDGAFDPALVSRQVGAAVALRHLVDTQEICICQ